MNQLAKRVITQQVMKREFSGSMLVTGLIFVGASEVISRKRPLSETTTIQQEKNWDKAERYCDVIGITLSLVSFFM